MFDFELPEGYRGALHTNVDVYLGFIDRIKVLLGWRLTVKTQIFTQHEPGKTQTQSLVRVWRVRRRGIAYSVYEDPETLKESAGKSE